MRSRRRARSSESTDSMASKVSTARRALLPWRGPRRCHVPPSTRGRLSTPSWTRFSPNRSWPQASAARTRSAGTVFETATRATSEGSRPAFAQARSIRWSTAARDAANRAISAGSVTTIGGRRQAGIRRRRSLAAAEEARDLELVGVVGGASRRLRQIADRTLGTDDRDADGRRTLVPAIVRRVIGRGLPLALEFLEEVTVAGLAHGAAGLRPVPGGRRLVTCGRPLPVAVEAGGDDGDLDFLPEALVEARPEDDV